MSEIRDAQTGSAVYVTSGGEIINAVTGRTAYTTSGFVESVNSQTGAVVLSASDVGAIEMPEGGSAGQYLKKTSNGVAWATGGGGSGGTFDYEELDNKPSLGGVVLIGEVTLEDVGAQTEITTSNKLSASLIDGIPVSSVNSKTGAVVLSAADVTAIPSDLSGSAGQIVAKTSDGYALIDAPSGGGVTSVNGQTGAVVLSAADVGATSVNGWEIEALSGTSVTSAGKVYTHTVAADDAFTFFTPPDSKTHEFELHLTQPATAVSFTFSASIKWGVNGEFTSSQTAPTMSTGGTKYALVFRWNGSAWLGNLAYTEA